MSDDGEVENAEQLDELLQENSDLRTAIGNFIRKHDEIEPHLNGVFVFYGVHGMKWPEDLNWKAELDVLRSLK